MRNIVFFFFAALTLVQCKPRSYTEPHVLISTSFGDIEIELYQTKAPRSVAAFLSYIDSGYYAKSAFYRVLRTEGLTGDNSGMIQGGAWQNNDPRIAAVPGIPHESTQLTGLTHTTGMVSLARTKPGTAGTEFFICIGDQTQYDYGNEHNGDREGYAAFGKVIKGMKVVREIQNEKTNGESFTPVITIKSIRRL